MRAFRLFQHHIAYSTLLELCADSVLCFVVALSVVSAFHVVPGAARQIPLDADLVWIACQFAIAMMLLYSFVGLYRTSSVPVQRSSIVRRALLALLVGTLIAYLLFQSVAGRFSPGHLLGMMLLLFMSLVLVRVLVSAFRRAVGAPRVLIIGTGPEAQRVAADLSALHPMGRQVAGFYPTTAEVCANLPPEKVFSRQLSIPEVVARNDIDEIIVAARERRGGEVAMDQLLACRIRGTPVLDLAGFYELTRAVVPLDGLKASWLVYGEGFVQGRARQAAKRVFDIVTSAVLLVLAAPVMLLTALAIRLDSSGPVIYRQERVGLGGRSFMCLKFRSMRVDAEKDGVARWATQGDTRVTRVGAFIRKTRIDELPQLLSVLKGEMSMVGPRPERPSFVAQLRQEIPFYDVRHSVKPGVTGWAQVRYSYGASVEDARHKHQYDLYYVKNNSLFLDVLVLIETVSVVLFHEGAR